MRIRRGVGLVQVKVFDEALNEISDLNMALYYKGEFGAWRGGSARFLMGDGNFMGVARFAQRRGFVGKRVHAAQSLPPLSAKGCDLIGMTPAQNRGRWMMLVEALKESGV